MKLRRALFPVVTVVATFVLGHFALGPLVRTEFDAYAPLFTQHPIRWAALAPNVDIAAPVGVFQPDVWGERDNTYRIRTDAHGRRVPVSAKDAAGAAQVVCVGDSGTFGWDVEAEDAYCSQVAEILSDRAGKPVRTVNLGVPGYSSLQARAYLDAFVRGVRPGDVAAVIVGVGANDTTPIAARDYRFLRGRTDAEVLVLTGSGWERIPRWMRALTVIEDNNVFRALAMLFDRPAVGGGDAASGRRRVSPDRHAANVRAMVAAAKRVTDRVAVVHIAVDDPRYHEAARVAAQAGGAAYVQDRRVYADGLGGERGADPRPLLVTTDHGHPNARGHRMIAEALVDALLLLPVD